MVNKDKSIPTHSITRLKFHAPRASRLNHSRLHERLDSLDTTGDWHSIPLEKANNSSYLSPPIDTNLHDQPPVDIDSVLDKINFMERKPIWLPSIQWPEVYQNIVLRRK